MVILYINGTYKHQKLKIKNHDKRGISKINWFEGR
nr:MAG TPA: hypothetical protein [Caudoviricetes sp.]